MLIIMCIREPAPELDEFSRLSIYKASFMYRALAAKLTKSTPALAVPCAQRESVVQYEWGEGRTYAWNFWKLYSRVTVEASSSCVFIIAM